MPHIQVFRGSRVLLVARALRVVKDPRESGDSKVNRARVVPRVYKENVVSRVFRASKANPGFRESLVFQDPLVLKEPSARMGPLVRTGRMAIRFSASRTTELSSLKSLRSICTLTVTSLSTWGPNPYIWKARNLPRIITKPTCLSGLMATRATTTE